jgi:hypothetical protein
LVGLPLFIARPFRESGGIALGPFIWTFPASEEATGIVSGSELSWEVPKSLLQAPFLQVLILLELRADNFG